MLQLPVKLQDGAAGWRNKVDFAGASSNLSGCPLTQCKTLHRKTKWVALPLDRSVNQRTLFYTHRLSRTPLPVPIESDIDVCHQWSIPLSSGLHQHNL